MEKRKFVDAVAVKSEIQEYHDSLKPRYISKLADAEIADVLDIIDEQTTVDAVEVVRCKDCRYLEITGCYGECVKLVRIVRPWDFCSYGERREGE